jgi:hypothetical protein
MSEDETAHAASRGGAGTSGKPAAGGVVPTWRDGSRQRLPPAGRGDWRIGGVAGFVVHSLRGQLDVLNRDERAGEPGRDGGGPG